MDYYIAKFYENLGFINDIVDIVIGRGLIGLLLLSILVVCYSLFRAKLIFDERKEFLFYCKQNGPIETAKERIHGYLQNIKGFHFASMDKTEDGENKTVYAMNLSLWRPDFLGRRSRRISNLMHDFKCNGYVYMSSDLDDFYSHLYKWWFRTIDFAYVVRAARVLRWVIRVMLFGMLLILNKLYIHCVDNYIGFTFEVYVVLNCVILILYLIFSAGFRDKTAIFVACFQYDHEDEPFSKNIYEDDDDDDDDSESLDGNEGGKND